MKTLHYLPAILLAAGIAAWQPAVAQETKRVDIDFAPTNVSTVQPSDNQPKVQRFRRTSSEWSNTVTTPGSNSRTSEFQSETYPTYPEQPASTGNFHPSAGQNALPGAQSYHQQGLFSSGDETGFFGGLTPDLANQAKAINLPKQFYGRPDSSPLWAKQKVHVRQFQDGVEHFGNEDPMGFF